MKEHTITKNENSLISTLIAQTFNTTDRVNIQRNYESYENDNIWVSQNEREQLGRLLLNSVDDVDVVEKSEAQQIADECASEYELPEWDEMDFEDVSDDVTVLGDFFESQVKFIAGSDVCIEDGSGGEVVLMGSETKNLYEALDEYYSEEDDSEEDEVHNENQSLPDNRDEYDWFDPDAENVTCLTDGDTYDVNKYIVEKERTCTLVEQIRHHYKHVQLHEKEVENLRELWDDSKGDDSDDDGYYEVRDDLPTVTLDEAMWGLSNATVPDDSDSDDGEITECLCGHDPHWEDHGLCPFEDDTDSLCVCGRPSCENTIAPEELSEVLAEETNTTYEEIEREAEQLLAGMESIDDSGDDDGCDWCGGYENPDYSSCEGRCICEIQSCDDGMVCAIDGSDDESRPIDELFPQVSLDVEVSVEGASDEQRQMYQDMARMVEENFETFVQKNRDYGNSFLNTEVGLTDNGPFDTEIEANVNGLLVRMNDKQQRLNSLLFGGDDHVGEAAMDTALDLANYSLMLAYVVQDGGEN